MTRWLFAIIVTAEGKSLCFPVTIFVRSHQSLAKQIHRNSWPIGFTAAKSDCREVVDGSHRWSENLLLMTLCPVLVINGSFSGGTRGLGGNSFSSKVLSISLTQAHTTSLCASSVSFQVLSRSLLKHHLVVIIAGGEPVQRVLSSNDQPADNDKDRK